MSQLEYDVLRSCAPAGPPPSHATRSRLTTAFTARLPVAARERRLGLGGGNDLAPRLPHPHGSRLGEEVALGLVERPQLLLRRLRVAGAGHRRVDHRLGEVLAHPGVAAHETEREAALQ